MEHKVEVVLTIFVVAAISGITLWLRGEPVERTPIGDRSSVRSAQAAMRERPTASIVLSIDPTRPSGAAARRAQSPMTLAREFEQAGALRPLYERLSAPGAAATAEAKYVLYRILGTCARKTDANPPAPAPASTAERRRQLAASIPDASPLKAVRLKAFDDLARCAGLEDLTTTTADLDKLLDAAARDGDPRARALQVQRELGSEMPRGAPPITDAQLQALRDSVASRDPAAIAIAGTVLSNTFGDLVMEVGDAHDALDPAASRQAWRLLACEYGLDCGSDNPELRMSCAFAGRCGPSTIPDHIYFYETTPNQAQLVEQYRQLFRRAIDAGDWSGVTFARRSNAPQSVFRYFTPGP